MSSSVSTNPLAEKEEIAADVVAASRGHIGVKQAMRIVHFSDAEMNDNTIYRRIHRLAEKKKKTLATIPPPEVVAVPALTLAQAAAACAAAPSTINDPSDLSGNSSSFNPPSIATDNTTAQSSTCAANPRALESVKRVLEPGSASSSAEKRTRKTPKQKQAEDAKKLRASKLRSKALKMATVQIQQQKTKTSGSPVKPNAHIVRSVNEALGSNIAPSTVNRYIQNNMIGVSPMKRGPAPDIPSDIWKALKAAFTSYIKLEQAHSKQQSTVKTLSLRVNTLLNKFGYNKSGEDTTRKLRKETADEFSVDKTNMVEMRRLLWTTYGNLNLWYTTWKETLLELGFARERVPGEEPQPGDDLDMVEGELVFFEGQRRRIVNFDETDGSLDNTKGQRGGRPPVVFYAPKIGGGGTQAS